MGKKETGTTLCYIKDAEYAWVPAILTKTEGDKAYVQVPQYKDEQSIMSDGGRASKGAPVEKVINLKDYAHKVLPLQNVDKNGCLTEHADMVRLPYLHEVCFAWHNGSIKPATKSVCTMLIETCFFSNFS